MMTDDGKADIDSQWVLDYRTALKAKTVTETGRSSSGFLFTISDFETYRALFVDRKRYHWGVKMPESPFGRKKRPVWPGTPQFPGKPPNDVGSFHWGGFAGKTYCYPFEIRTFGGLYAVDLANRDVWRGDGDTGAPLIKSLPDDMLDMLAHKCGFTNRNAFVQDFVYDVQEYYLAYSP